MSDRTAVYEAFLAAARLTDEHRRGLREKRGFTDEAIDELRLRSGGPYVAAVLDRLKEDFGEERLIAAGLFTEVNGVVLPEDQLLGNRVLIPYLDAERQCYHLRPHKLGFRGFSPEPYCTFVLGSEPRETVLTEGEFKAAALWQWGFSAIAVPGVSSFAGIHFERLGRVLAAAKAQNIVIVYDNEIKNDPQYPNYKERPEDRWDTPFWAVIMVKKLKRAGFTARIGQLPDEWRVDGKVDFDSALAQGRTKEQIQSILDASKYPDEFIQTLPDEGQRIVKRKIAIYFTPSPVYRNFNRYVRQPDENETQKPISNFVIDIHSSFFTPEGCIRYVSFVNEHGERSGTFTLMPGDMVSVDSFRRFCFSQGSYIYKGTTSDLQDIWQYELLRDMGDVVHMPEQIGEIKPGFWMFGNVAVHQGNVLHPDRDGIFWVDGVGYKPQSLTVGPKGEIIEDAIPALDLHSEINIKEIVHHFRRATGGGYEACIGLGWVVATLFSRPIFAHYKAFPFPFVHGKREAGKSTFMRWLMGFFGSESDGVSLSETTQNYIMRALSYYSSLGIWFDEYRNEQKITQKDGYLRSAYNRQLAGKGIRDGFGARSYVVRGTVAVSGEELPRDNGLFTRVVPIRVSASRRDPESFEWMNRRQSQFSAFTLQLLTRYNEIEKPLLQTIRELKTALVDAGISDRSAENWAIMAGSYYAVVDQDNDFIRWVKEIATEVRREAEEEHMLSVFWSDVSVLVSEHQIGRQHIALTDTGQMAVWFAGVYNKWAAYYRQRTGREPFDRLSIGRYIKEEGYFHREKTHILDGTRRKCYMITLAKAPDTILEIADELQQREENTVIRQIRTA